MDVPKILGIEDLLYRLPKELSGGQRQRVALARAIVRKAKVFLLDEPLSNLDASLREKMRSELKLLFRRIGATVIYVTHDQVEAMTMSDKIAVIQAGIIKQAGKPLDIYKKPSNSFIAGFIGTPRANFIKGKILNSEFTSIDKAIRLFCGAKDKECAVLVIRPEDISLNYESEEFFLKGKTILIEPLGASTIVTVRIGLNELKTICSHEKLEDTVSVRFNEKNLLFFDELSGDRIL